MLIYINTSYILIHITHVRRGLIDKSLGMHADLHSSSLIAEFLYTIIKINVTVMVYLNTNTLELPHAID